VPREDGRRASLRTWDFWTEQKLSMLAAYLPAFTTASQRSPRTLYFDLFAGDHRNLSRRTGEPITGSPRVALNTTPQFSKVILSSCRLRRGDWRLSSEPTTRTGTSRS
jgi:three-Cys-motif partner protein